MPMASIRLATSGALIAAITSRWIRSATDGSSPPGATSPKKLSAWKPGSDSASVGICGSCRLCKVGGDFFSDIPVQANCLLLKSVLHDRDDAHSQRILANCARAMRPHTRLVIIERVLGEGPSSNAYLVDLHMMMFTGGRERTLDEDAALAASAGLVVTGATRTAHGKVSVREVIRLIRQGEARVA